MSNQSVNPSQSQGTSMSRATSSSKQAAHGCRAKETNNKPMHAAARSQRNGIIPPWHTTSLTLGKISGIDR